LIGLILPTHKKVVFFFTLLISLTFNRLNAQTNPNDTLKKVSADTLNADENTDALEERVQYDANDSIVGTPQDGRVLLYGKAVVNYGTMKMESEFMEIDYIKNMISAYGKKDSLGNNVGTPIFRDGGETPIEAEKIMYNLKTKKGKIFNALTKQGELLVIGNEIKKDSTNVIYFKNMKCIPCQEEDAKSARTVFRATKAKVIPDDKIVTGPMYLEVGGVPTPLGLPFGYFPSTKKQHNGVLLPTFGNSPAQGYNLKQGGFYWGINDQTDMIFRGDVYANGSYMASLNNNYNILYKSNGATNISYSSFNIGDKDIPAQFSKQKAYEVRWQHYQDNKSNPRVRFSANVNYVNNQSFNRFNAINTGQYLQNNFQSNINFTRSFKLSNLSINALHNQNSISKQVNITLPALTFNVNRFFPFRRENAVKQNVLDKIGINYLFEARNILTGYDSTIFKGSLIDSARYGFRHGSGISTNFNVLKYIIVTPGINLSSVMYPKSIHKDYYREIIGDTMAVDRVRTVEDPGFVAGYDANFSTSASTQVYFDYMFKKGKVKQIRHMLIPTLNYTYRPDFGESQYGFWKNVQRDSLGRIQTYSIFERGIFSGPSRGKQNSVGLTLSNNIETKLKQITDTGFTYRKVVIFDRINLGGNYNFAADSFKMSPITMEARSLLFKKIDVVLQSHFDPYVYNKATGSVIDKYVFENDGRVARLTNVDLRVSAALGSSMIDAIKKARTTNSTNGAERGAEVQDNPRDQLPWNLSASYNLRLANSDDRVFQPTHQLGFTGDMMPTKYWRVGLSTNFDFASQKFVYTSVNIYRDLKCWEARIEWIPFGPRRSYNFGINLKASMLRDFRIPRQRAWYDFR
jgi:hypothetical protein